MATNKEKGTKRTEKKNAKRTRRDGAKQPPSSPTARPARDPRLPEPGTVLRKTDRQGNLRCQCTVEVDGVRYDGQLYRSLSAAATAAAADLHVKGAQNGYVFWGLSRPARAGEDPLTRLQKSWARYEACAGSVVATASPERKPELIAAIERNRSLEIAAA